MIEAWKIEKEELIYECPIFNAYRSWRKNPRTSTQIDFMLVRGLDWTNVLALTESNQVVMVRQFRHGIEANSLELPGGCIETTDNNSAAGALREFTEETGFSAELHSELLSAHANPAMMNQRLTIYLATNATLVSQQRLDEGEDIEVELVDLEKIPQLISEGKITHTTTIAAFGMLALKNQSSIAGFSPR